MGYIILIDCYRINSNVSLSGRVESIIDYIICKKPIIFGKRNNILKSKTKPKKKKMLLTLCKNNILSTIYLILKDNWRRKCTNKEIEVNIN